MKVTRVDATATLSPGRELGVYRVRAGRTGAMTYGHGTEHRDAAELFDADSVASMVGARVQVTHDAGAPTVGRVEQPFRRELIGTESYLEVAVRITDPAVRARIDRREISEVSCGYTCEVVDGRQRRIRYDHLALLPLDQRARCGSECRVHLDSIQTKGCSQLSCSCTPRHDVLAAAPSGPGGYYLRIPGTSPAARNDAAEARLDAAADLAGVPRDAVRAALLARTTAVPSERDIEDAVHTARLAARVKEMSR